MKKILALILAALMVLTMFACAAKTEPAKEAEQTTTTEPAEETTPEETAPAAEETTEEPAVGGTISDLRFRNQLHRCEAGSVPGDHQ